MKCPIDSTQLVMSERQGVEIDYCPQCRGVWLDRGEIDKIIDRSQSPTTTSAPNPQLASEVQSNQFPPNDYHQPRRKKKESFLSDLFDFD